MISQAESAELIRRVGAVEKTLAKYRGRGLDWRTADCVRMARSHLVVLGHRPPSLPRYSTPQGAVRALRRAGFDGLEALFDSLLPRIAPAQRWLGDLVLMQGDEGSGVDSVTISAGHKLIGWMDDQCVVMTPHEIKAAWRV